jgi:hypothetical protein
LWGPSAQYMLSSNENPFYGVNRPMTVPMERVENRILSIRGHRVICPISMCPISIDAKTYRRYN